MCIRDSSHTINTNPIFREDGTQIPQEPIRVNYQPTVTTDVNKLTSIIEKLPGDKFVFTNGSKKHAENVIQQLQMNKIFDDIFDIKDSNFIPKPNINAYLSFINKTKIKPETSIMFEDIGRNLEPAKKLGMKTVLIKRKTPIQNKKFKTKDFELSLIHI